jgi:hypothetical protein
MKKIPNASTVGLIALSFVAAFSVSARAQTPIRDDRVITARAGGVNLVEGKVQTQRAGEKDWQRLTVKDDLHSGDAVRTGVDGRVEVLLNPGSYFRAGAVTEFALADESLDNLKLALAHGSAVIEATGYDNLDLSITVATPRSMARITRAGVYRFDVLPSGEMQLSVLKGRALAGNLIVKGGQVARFDAGAVEIAKLDKSQRDALDVWSRDRGKELAKENERLANRATNALLARAGYNSSLLLNNFGYPPSGAWLFSARLGCYTFLPFFYGWSSPYGFGYGSYWPAGYGLACGCYGPGERPYWPRPGTYTAPTPTSSTGVTSSPGPVHKGTPVAMPSAPPTASMPSAPPSQPARDFPQPARDFPQPARDFSRGDVSRPTSEPARGTPSRP